jgi:hypothetical protein
MKRSTLIISVILAALAGWVCGALADTTDSYINQLKDPNPDVRAKAAFELSCG